MSENESSNDGPAGKNWTAEKSIAALKAANSGPARTVEDSFSTQISESTLAFSAEIPASAFKRKVEK